MRFKVNSRLLQRLGRAPLLAKTIFGLLNLSDEKCLIRLEQEAGEQQDSLSLTADRKKTAAFMEALCLGHIEQIVNRDQISFNRSKNTETDELSSPGKSDSDVS